MLFTYQCSCSNLDYELTDQSLQLIGVPSEFVTQQTSESRRHVKYIAGRFSRRHSLSPRRKKKASVEEKNATNQMVAERDMMVTDYSHEKRPCDTIVIEGKARRRIVKASRATTES